MEASSTSKHDVYCIDHMLRVVKGRSIRGPDAESSYYDGERPSWLLPVASLPLHLASLDLSVLLVPGRAPSPESVSCPDFNLQLEWLLGGMPPFIDVEIIS